MSTFRTEPFRANQCRVRTTQIDSALDWLLGYEHDVLIPRQQMAQWVQQ